MLLVYAVPLAKRPQYQGLFGAVYGISSVIGPLVGGAFTTNVSYRWAFYINIPFGGVVFLFVTLLLRVPVSAASRSGSTWGQKFKQLNIEGVVPLLGGVISFCLALQWGGFTYAVSVIPGIPIPMASFLSPYTCRTDYFLVERWAYHRITYGFYRTFDRLRLGPDLDAGDSHGAAAHFHRP